MKTNLKLFSVMAIAVLLMAALPVTSVGATPGTLYVDVTGSCGGNSPCFTHPQDAVNAANPGDTILVYPGTYDSRYKVCNPTYPTWCSTSDNWAPALIIYKDGITVKAVDPDPAKTVIQSTHTVWSNAIAVKNSTNGGVNVSGWSPNAAVIVANNVTIEGFTFHRPFNCTNTNDCFWNTAGVFIGSRGAGSTDFLGRANGAIVTNNVFSDVWHAVYMWHSSGNQIINNKVEALGNTGHWAAISSYDGWDSASAMLQPQGINNIVAYNTIADKGISLGAWAPSTWTSNAGSKVVCNTTTEVGVAYSQGPVLVAYNTGSFWQSNTDDVLHITGITYTGPTDPIAVDPVTHQATVSLRANLVYDGTADGSGIDVTFTLDGIAVQAKTLAGGSANTIINLAPGVYNIQTKASQDETCGYTDSAMFVVYDPSGGFVTGGGWIDSPIAQSKVVFDTIPNPLPGNLPSQPYQAQQTAEFGDYIQFAGTARELSGMTVTMSSWAKHSDYPTMPVAGFVHPVTLNLYNVDKSGPTPALGTLIKSVTQDFVMQWRPEGDPTCPDTGYGAGFAWRASNGTCYNGFAFNIVFDLSNEGITLPDEIIYGIASNTQTWGYAPIGTPGPYNSLNFALNNISSPSTGIDVEPDAVFWNTKTAAWYSDGGAGGTGTFRRDTGWTGLVPAIRFSVTPPGAYVDDPTLGGKATFGFVSKYKKGATVPDGNTEFQFKAGNLNFSSTSYEWLVVNQAGTNAQFKGIGTINGSGKYGFMLWASDGAPDTFRIKIWEVATDTIVYDNGTDQAIGRGSIVVKKK